MSTFEIRLFGYPKFLVDGEPLKLERRKTTALLAYLAVECGQGTDDLAGIGRETLATLFWPDAAQEQASAYLRQALWDFAKTAGERWIERDANLVHLEWSAGIQADTARFDALYEQWKAGGPGGAPVERLLERMVELYRDDFLSGFNLRNCPAFDNWQTVQCETFRLRLAQALEALTDIKTDQGDYYVATNHARRWLGLDMLNEAAHRALMQIFEHSGRHNAALRQFETCRLLLLDELGAQPSDETLVLYRQIRERTTHAHERRAPQPGFVQPVAPAQPRPTGTVTFVFTDIEGSTHLWEHQKDEMQRAFDRQEAIIRSAMAAHGGYVYKMIGDAFQVAFSTAPQALAATLQAQRALHAERWGDEIGELKVRMALHAGVTEEREDDYVGPALNRVARLLGAGFGGQVLVSQAVHDLLRDDLAQGVSLRYLGEYHLKDLVQPERIYQLVAEGLPDDFPPLKAVDARMVRLPAQTTPFVGRETELGNIQAMLDDPACRLITLLGIGGSGKTRLAIRAAELCRGFRDGVSFIALAQATTLDDLVLAIAEGVNLTLHTLTGIPLSFENARLQLFQYLAGKNFLLVLDNLEQLTAHTPLLAELLDAAPMVKMIVTSRQRLNLPAEWVLELGGLSFPSNLEGESLAGYPAVDLFLKTAERNAGFIPTADDWHAILRICQFIEGIPLGLEMAATWTKMLTCQEIAAEIEQNLDFLSATWRGMPERHRTLRAVFEHSWRLLTEVERTVFSRLSVFCCSFSREAALQVAGASLPMLSDFNDRSFLRRTAAGRFEIHPLLRRYASEKLAADPVVQAQVRARAAIFYAEWLAGMFEKLKGAEQLTALITLRREAPNLNSAMGWLVEQVDCARLAVTLPAWILYHVMNDQRLEIFKAGQIFLDAIERLRPRAVDPDAPETALLALSLAAAHYFRVDARNPGAMQSYVEESLSLVERIPDSMEKAYALLLDCIGPSHSPIERVQEMCRQSVALFERLNEPWGAAMAHMITGDLNCFVNFDAEKCRAAYTAAVEGFTSLGCDWGRALCMTGLTYLERQLDRPEEAYQLGRASLEIYDQLGNYERMAPLRDYLGMLAESWGQHAEAHQLYEANLAYYIQRGDEGAQRVYRERLARLGNG